MAGRGRHRIHAVTSSLEPPVTVRRVGREQNIKRFEKPIGRFALAPDVPEPGALTLEEAFTRVTSDWDRQADDGLVSHNVAYSYASLIRSFVGYASAHGVIELYDVTPTLVLEWMHSPTAKGEPPANSTRLNRRSTARQFFATAQKLGLHDMNPAASVMEYRRIDRHVHPFTAAQLDQLKRVAEYRFGEYKSPTMLALMLLGATAREVAYVRVGDVDLGQRRLWLHGGAEKNRPRWVPIDDDWAEATLVRRLAAIALEKPHLSARDISTVLLAYRPKKVGDNPAKRSAAIATTMDKLLRVARVYVAGQTRLESIRESLAVRVFSETGRLEDVAVRLGLSSLDTIAHIVGIDWVQIRGIAAPPPDVDGESW